MIRLMQSCHFSFLQPFPGIFPHFSVTDMPVFPFLSRRQALSKQRRCTERIANENLIFFRTAVCIYVRSELQFLQTLLSCTIHRTYPPILSTYSHLFDPASLQRSLLSPRALFLHRFLTVFAAHFNHLFVWTAPHLPSALVGCAGVRPKPPVSSILLVSSNPTP